MTVKELIKELLGYNQDVIVFVGDNLYNIPEICYGGSDGCTKKNCEDVGILIKGKNDCEIKQPASIKHCFKYLIQ